MSHIWVYRCIFKAGYMFLLPAKVILEDFFFIIISFGVGSGGVPPGVVCDHASGIW